MKLILDNKNFDSCSGQSQDGRTRLEVVKNGKDLYGIYERYGENQVIEIITMTYDELKLLCQMLCQK